MAASRASMKKSVVKEFQCFLFFSEAEAKSCTLHAAHMHAYIHTLGSTLRCDLEAHAQSMILPVMEALVYVVRARHHKALALLVHSFLHSIPLSSVLNKPCIMHCNYMLATACHTTK